MERIKQSTKASSHPQPRGGHDSFKKLLNSHSSIYNALTNPDLDVSPSPPLRQLERSRFTPDLNDQQFSITSWQTMSEESSHKNEINRPCSILSLSTDDDTGIKDSPVIVQSPKTTSNTMVFETDEEDLDDLDDLKNPSDFIMPKMMVSSTNSNSQEKTKSSKFEVTILSSNLLSNYDSEIDKLTNLSQDYIHNLVNFNHLKVDKSRLHPDSLKEYSSVGDSNLIFVINDGSKILVEFLASIIKDETFPKLTIINIMTVNYFVTLFDLINTIKPYQIWKTSSLQQEKLLNKFKDFIKFEVYNSDFINDNIEIPRSETDLNLKLLNQSQCRPRCQNQTQMQHPPTFNSTPDPIKGLAKSNSKFFDNFEILDLSSTCYDLNFNSPDMVKSKNLIEISQSNTLKQSDSVYSNLISNKRFDYKSSEKKFKSDLESSYHPTDPLKISESNINLCYSIIKNLFRKYKSSLVKEENNNLWLLLSFSIGIGLGVGIGISSGTETLVGLGFGFLENLRGSIEYILNQSRELNTEQANDAIFYPVASTSNAYADFVTDKLDQISNSNIIDEFWSYAQEIPKSLLLTGSMVVRGFQKLMGLIFI